MLVISTDRWILSSHFSMLMARSARKSERKRSSYSSATMLTEEPIRTRSSRLSSHSRSCTPTTSTFSAGTMKTTKRTS
ncbi:hypothetical protein PMAYCL1PPCAC_00647, partial [Pristionchus mayeri]